MDLAIGRTVRRRWWVGNAVGFSVAYLVYSPIAHGVTGPHPTPLSGSQLIAHTLGLVVVSVMVLTAQMWALGNDAAGHRARLAAGVLAFVAAFWIGWYAVGAPADIFISYIVLATASWITLENLSGARLLATALVVLAMLSGTAVGFGVFVALVQAGAVTMQVQESALSHMVLWLCVGVCTGIVGGFASGRALARVFPEPPSAT